MSPRSLKVRISGALCALTLLLALTLVIIGWFSSPQILLADSHIIYVNDTAGGSGNGSSWDNAYPKLQDALAASTTGDKIWVAAGIYYPDEGVGKTDDLITETFELKSGVALYGGFAGTESEVNQRNFTKNITILSGDVQKNDDSGAGKIVTDVNQIAGVNSINVLFANGVNTTAQLDGFVVTAGAAIQSNKYCSEGACGGGLYSVNSSMTLANVTFSGNTGYYGGGALFIGTSTPTLTNVLFTANKSEVYGGGLQVQDGVVITLKNVRFVENEAVSKGGGAFIYNSGTANFENATFTGNTSQSQGAGLGILNSAVTVKGDSIFASNAAASHGGAIYAESSALTMTHASLTRNASTTDGGGGAIYQSGGTLKISHTEITRNSAWDKGGGLALFNVDAILSNVKFLGNYVALVSGGESAYGGGMAVEGGALAVSNLLFSGNHSDDAGAIYLKGVNTTLHHVTIAAQEAPKADTEQFSVHGILVDGGSVTLNHCIIWAVNQKSIQTVNGGGYAGGNTVFEGPDHPMNNIGIMTVSTSPFRATPNPGDDGYGNDPSTPADESANDNYGDLRLNASTAVIDAGDNSKLPADLLDVDGDSNTSEPLPIDLDGNARVARFRAATALVDPGAYEYFNIAPTAKIAHPYIVNEGSHIDLDATGSSDDGGIITYAWDCTNDNSMDVTGDTPTQGICTYPNSGNFTLRLLVTDSLNVTAGAITSVTVANVAPTYTPGANQFATAGIATAFFLGAFTDPGAEGAWSISIKWGDNSKPAQLTVNSVGALPSMSHTYATAGSYDVVVTVNDDAGSDDGSFKVQVNAPLLSTPIVFPPKDQEATTGTEQMFNLGSFTDADSSGPWQVTVKWGDDSEGTVFEVKSSGQLPTQAHTYIEPGEYEVSVSVSDGASVAKATFRVTTHQQEERATILLPLMHK